MRYLLRHAEVLPLQDLHLQHLRLSTENLLDLHFPRFGKHLQRLCLRQNNLTSPLPHEAFDGLEALEELDLYDNKLGHRVHDKELSGCLNLTYVISRFVDRNDRSDGYSQLSRSFVQQYPPSAITPITEAYSHLVSCAE